MGSTYRVALSDGKTTTKCVEVSTSTFCGYLEVWLPEHGTKMSIEEDPVVLIDYSDGQFKLYIWADINQEDPTHVIDMSGALLSAREDEDDA